jgi:outer membrane biogenesis lipoprotein LolB
MQGLQAFCLRLGVLCIALAACSADDSTGPSEPGPEAPLPPQAALRVIRDYNTSQPLAHAADLAELDASAGDRYWYDAGTGLLHLKLVTRAGRTSTNVLVEPQ